MGGIFGLSFGADKKKSITNTSGTFSTTTTPIVPDWAASAVQGAAGRVGELMGMDPYGFVAPAHGLQRRAAAGAENLGGMSWNFDGAADLMRGAALAPASTYQAATYDPAGYQASTYDGARLGPVSNAAAGSLLENLDAYMSPYRRDVVDAALDDFDVGAGRTRAQLDLDLAGSGAFGGSGAALTRSMTEGELARGRASASANLLDQMFNRGAALSGQDADRRTQVSLANAAAANTTGLHQAQFDQQAGLERAAALTDAARYGADAGNAAGRFNAEALNAAGGFNAGQLERLYGRQMDAARGLTDLSTAYEANQRANIATQAGLGETLRGFDQEQRQAPITHAQQIVAMLSGLPISLFVGRDERGTKAETSKTKSKGVNVGATASFDIPFGGKQ